MKYSALLIIALCFNVTVLFADDEQSFKTTGFIKTFPLAYKPYNKPPEGMASILARESLKYVSSEEYKFEAAFALSPTIQPSMTPMLPLVGSPKPYTYRPYDLGKYLVPQDGNPAGSFSVGQNLDRLAFTFSSDHIEATVGRQVIAFGASKIVSPTDVFAPFTFTDFDTEIRVGIDAVRARIPTGERSGFDLGYVAGEKFLQRESGGFARYATGIGAFDSTASIIDFKDNLLIGLDTAGSIGGAGVWVEGAYVLTGYLGTRTSQYDFARVSIGVDYVPREKTYLIGEYHYNGCGKDSPADYITLATHPMYLSGGAYLLGKHYLSVSGQYAVSQIFSMGLSAMANLSDSSVNISPRATYEFSSDTMIQAGAFFTNGRSVDILTLSTSGPASEYGLYPDMYFLSVKRYY